MIKQNFSKTIARILFFALLTGSIDLVLLPKNNAQASEKEYSLRFDGRKRTYIVYEPEKYGPGRPTALVIVLHGGGGNANNAMKMTRMSEKADDIGFIVAYPNGSGRLRRAILTWNAEICCGFALDRNIDDVGFIRKMITAIESNYNIDQDRIYATGMSNGAMMAYRLACELSDVLAAIAPVAGSFPARNCTPKSPISVLIFHGTEDRNILYQGGKPKRQVDRHARVDVPVADAVSFWIEHNQCSREPEETNRERFKREAYKGGRGGTKVVLYTIKGGGHAWPGGEKGFFLGDKPTDFISATDVIWDFFEKHPKKQTTSN